jgi:hypothetical protein
LSVIDDFSHCCIDIFQFMFDEIFDGILESFGVKTTTIITSRNDSSDDLISLKHLFAQLDVCIDTIFNRLHVRKSKMSATIRKRPSIIAISPPVLVPPIRSKYSQGRGVSLAPVRRWISSMISFKTNSEDSPLTPPPSSDRSRGQ